MSRVAHTYPAHCAAEGCGALIREGLLMCAPHWRLVPSTLQSRVYRKLAAWKEGASVREYIEARDAAIASVAKHQESAL